MAEGALPFDDDHVGIFALERGDDLVLDLGGTVLRHQGVEGDAVFPAMNDRRLPRTDQYGANAMVVQRTNHQGRGGATKNGGP